MRNQNKFDIICISKIYQNQLELLQQNEDEWFGYQLENYIDANVGDAPTEMVTDYLRNHFRFIVYIDGNQIELPRIDNNKPNARPKLPKVPKFLKIHKKSK